MNNRPIWRIGFTAGLLGLGQNGLLVALPMLVATTELSLAQWAALLLLGTMLFMAGGPLWGRMVDRHGPCSVVAQALIGFIGSFALIGLAVWLYGSEAISSPMLLALLVLARLLYGLTLSGLVPACQRWSVALQPDTQRMRALTRVSAGLTVGRLVGPLLAGACLVFSLHLLFVALIAAGLLALALLQAVPRASIANASAGAGDITARQGVGKATYLAMAALLAMAMSLLNLGLPPALQDSLDIDAERASHLMSVLLFFGAAGALAVQTIVVRSRRTLPERALLISGALGIASGFALLLQADGLTAFAVGVVAAHAAAAVTVPAYTAAATDNHAQSASAGLVAMAHTAGHGLAMLLIAVSAPSRLLAWGLLAAALIAALLPVARRRAEPDTPRQIKRDAAPRTCAETPQPPSSK